MLLSLNSANGYSFYRDLSQNMIKPVGMLIVPNVRYYSSANNNLPDDFLDLFSPEFKNDAAFNVVVSNLEVYFNLVSQLFSVINSDLFDFNSDVENIDNVALINRINMLRDNIKHILKEHKFSKNDINKIFISYPIIKNPDVNLELFDIFNDSYSNYNRVLNKYDVAATPRFISDVKQIFYILYLANNCKNVFPSDVLSNYNRIPDTILSALISTLGGGKVVIPDNDGNKSKSTSSKKISNQQLFTNVFVRKELGIILMNLYKTFSSNILNTSNIIINDININKSKLKEKELLLRDLEAKAATQAALEKERAELKALQDQMNLLRYNLAVVFSSDILELSFNEITNKSKFKKVLSYVNNKAKDFNKLMGYNLDFIFNIISSFESMKPVQRSRTFSFDSPFYNELDKIINGAEFKDLSLVDKQRLIEDACIKYEKNLFDINMQYLKDKGLNVQTSVLHDLNFKLVKFINGTLQPYTINKYDKLIKEKDLYKIKIILLLIFLTPNFIVNILFSNNNNVKLFNIIYIYLKK